MRKLTEKEKSFIKAYLRLLNGTQAIAEAYPNVKSKNTAGVMAYELLCKPKIKKIIKYQAFKKNNCGGDFIDFKITE